MKPLLKWDSHAVNLVKDQGFLGMSESAVIGIVKSAGIPVALLTLTFHEIAELAGYRQPAGTSSTVWAQRYRQAQTRAALAREIETRNAS